MATPDCNRELAQLMVEHGLSRKDVGALLELPEWRDPRRPSTIRYPAVDAWLAPAHTARYRNMPERQLRLLRKLLNTRSAGE